ncbi:MAG: hypothetical protein K2X66_10800 [Cyanobacteria bacterium]|nr:hypothetical protein [Cyanobacteriota bacterium]
MVSSMSSFPLPQFGASRRKASTHASLPPAVSKRVLNELSSIQQRQQSIMGAQKYIQGELQNIGTLLASVQQQIQTPKPLPSQPSHIMEPTSPSMSDFPPEGQWDVNAYYYKDSSSPQTPASSQEMHPTDFHW